MRLLVSRPVAALLLSVCCGEKMRTWRELSALLILFCTPLLTISENETELQAINSVLDGESTTLNGDALNAELYNGTNFRNRSVDSNAVANNTDEMVNNTNEMVNNTNEMVNNTNEMVNNTNEVANYTDQVANYTDDLNETVNVAIGRLSAEQVEPLSKESASSKALDTTDTTSVMSSSSAKSPSSSEGSTSWLTPSSTTMKPSPMVTNPHMVSTSVALLTIGRSVPSFTGTSNVRIFESINTSHSLPGFAKNRSVSIQTLTAVFSDHATSPDGHIVEQSSRHIEPSQPLLGRLRWWMIWFAIGGGITMAAIFTVTVILCCTKTESEPKPRTKRRRKWWKRRTPTSLRTASLTIGSQISHSTNKDGYETVRVKLTDQASPTLRRST